MARIRGLGGWLVRAWPGMAMKGRQIVGIGLAVMVVLAFAGLFLSRAWHGPLSATPTPTTGQFADNVPTATAATTATATVVSDVPSATATTVSTTPGATPLAIPSVTPSDGCVWWLPPPDQCALKLTHVDLRADTPAYNGLCTEMMPFDFTLTVTVAPHSGTGQLSLNVQYGGFVFSTPYSTWSEGPEITGTNEMTFAAGETTKSTHYHLGVRARDGFGTPLWMAVDVTTDAFDVTSPSATVVAPATTMSSPHADFSLTCVRQLTSITASASPNTWNAPCAANLPVKFSYAFTLSPGPPIAPVVTRENSGGFRSWLAPGPLPVTSSDDRTYTWTDENTLGNDVGSPTTGTYWEKIHLGAPYNVDSPLATITKNC